MSFQDAVRTCLTQKYADFNGRARRSEFWYFILFTVIVRVVTQIIDGILGTRDDFSGAGVVTGLVSLALLIPTLAVGARRLHDTDRSGWLQFLLIIPLIGLIILIVWWAGDSKGDNKHGPNPKGVGGYGEPAYQQMPPPAAPPQY
jgi:uncharacterized membrane protein YhaH (DUF805 family)